MFVLGVDAEQSAVQIQGLSFGGGYGVGFEPLKKEAWSRWVGGCKSLEWNPDAARHDVLCRTVGLWMSYGRWVMISSCGACRCLRRWYDPARHHPPPTRTLLLMLSGRCLLYKGTVYIQGEGGARPQRGRIGWLCAATVPCADGGVPSKAGAKVRKCSRPSMHGPSLSPIWQRGDPYARRTLFGCGLFTTLLKSCSVSRAKQLRWNKSYAQRDAFICCVLRVVMCCSIPCCEHFSII